MSDTKPPFPTYSVSKSDREPLVGFILAALESDGCRILHRPDPEIAPFQFTFVTPAGERIGLVVYAFLANNKQIRNRPEDEHRFQIKYGKDLSGIHEIWQDPLGVYVTLLVGINPDLGFFVALDPELHNPTRFSVSVEFKDRHVAQIEENGWFAWERQRRGGVPDPHKKRTSRVHDEEGNPLFETLVGGTRKKFLQLVQFERRSFRLSPGERHLEAIRFEENQTTPMFEQPTLAQLPAPPQPTLHALSKEFQLTDAEMLDLIAHTRMLKTAVRGSVAEIHLVDALSRVPGVTGCHRLSGDKGPDVSLRFNDRIVTIECKNSSRVCTSKGLMKIDFQRTRASKGDPCSRYYKSTDFDLVAACIHPITEVWEFRYAPTSALEAHQKCPDHLNNNVKLDGKWEADARSALAAVTVRT